ncbi:zinc ribbon domain-containing protein [Kineosporia sp. NBRC 101677]|uniref:FmdB family zinc ribbon protein n=1 Tax=Kineosporia sp. NBRC 101677 TaxID=3032197 RepID=UPI00332709E6
MPLYEFRCSACGSFERTFPMSTMPPSLACPDCAEPAVRRPGGSPGRGSSPVARAVEATHRSAHEPAVVRQPPPGPGHRVSRDPRHAQLPRP